MPAAAAAAPPLLRGLARNLSGGLALFVLRRRWPPRFVVSFDQVAALLAVNLAVWALLDKLHAPREAPLALDGLFGWACYLLLGLAGCALVARAQSAAANTRAIVVVSLSVAPFVLALLWLANDLAWVAAHPLTSTVVALIYLLVLSLRVLGAAYGPVRLRPALLSLALVLVSPFVFGFLDLDTRLWVPEEPGQTQSDDAGDAEALLYDQPSRIAAAVARTEPTQAGKTAAYFVGFAGDGDQAVFRREVQYAAQVFGERFGTADRSILLVNDVDDRDSYPLASVSGLEQTLKLLATRMSPEQDVLVLFLSSHGSEDGLEVQNGSLPLAQLTPEDLRAALDEAGIRWRLLIVSACYGGIFLEDLKTESTAIVTASDAAHSSFGCAGNRDLTWFGEAFLRDALPGSTSLAEAFHKAEGLIAQREDAEHETHSNPQLYMGPLIEQKLHELRTPTPDSGRSAFTVRR